MNITTVSTVQRYRSKEKVEMNIPTVKYRDNS